MQSQNETLLMVSLCKFYEDASNMERIVPIIEGTSDISLRLIDYFVTSYVKIHGTSIPMKLNNGMSSHLNVHLSYRSQLQAYSKQSFDCFRRHQRILFCYGESSDKSIETTVGQLNFFRWLLTNNILEYITENKRVIEREMMQRQKSTSAVVRDPHQSMDGKDASKKDEIAPPVIGDTSSMPEALMRRFPGTTTLTFV